IILTILLLLSSIVALVNNFDVENYIQNLSKVTTRDVVLVSTFAFFIYSFFLESLFDKTIGKKLVGLTLQFQIKHTFNYGILVIIKFFRAIIKSVALLIFFEHTITGIVVFVAYYYLSKYYKNEFIRSNKHSYPLNYRYQFFLLHDYLTSSFIKKERKSILTIS
ncbi:MAG: hypothetical protein N3E37_04545, partial [Candidatus Micrarchaeota archaeon]|nr:hypothetical protein [Candidatus Micrarchaeota archaeon]